MQSLGTIEEIDMIYHYTSAEALMSIIQENGIHLRFSQYDCLNDANEGGEAVRIQKEICEELIKENTEGQVLELIEKIAEVTPRYNALIAPKHGKPGEVTIKDGKLSGEASITVYNSETIPYICCFSKSKDSLPMWNCCCKKNSRIVH